MIKNFISGLWEGVRAFLITLIAVYVVWVMCSQFGWAGAKKMPAPTPSVTSTPKPHTGRSVSL